MEDGQIPVNLEDLSLEAPTLDESEVYSGELVKVALSPKLSKNGVMFCAIQVVVNDGDYEGNTVMLNYLPLPIARTPQMSKRDAIYAQGISAQFARFCSAFKIKGSMPPVRSLDDAESVAIWSEWANQFVGHVGKFTIKNQEFPEGSGRLRAGISDFIS